MLKELILISVTAIAAVTDIKKRTVPNKLIFPSILLALIYNIFSKGYENIVISIISSIVLILLYSINQNLIGGGDIKLIFFIVLMVGADMGNVVFFATIFTIPMLIYYFIKQKITKIKQVFPLALSLFVGVIMYLLVG